MSKPEAVPGHADVPSPLRSREGELMLLIAGQAQRVPAPVVITTTLMALLVADFIPYQYPALWLVLVYATTWFHTRLLRRLPTDAVRSEGGKLRLSAWSFAVHGVVLASLLVFFPLVPITIGAIITIYIVGIVAATLHAVAGTLRIYLPYCLVTLGPTALMWALAPVADISLADRLIFVGLVLMFFGTMIGHAKGTYGVFQESYDIRLQREALNERLRAALALAESANRSKTRFLASASHDLRQPIHALSLFSGALMLRPMDERAAAIAAQIDKSVQSVASLLDSLLDISRLDAGIVEHNETRVDLHTILSQLGEEFAPLAREKRLQLSVLSTQGLIARTDPMLFQRILRNLLSNAVKYTESGSVELRAEPDGDRCRVQVSDTGPGIPPSEQEHVFEEFYQLHNPERDRARGLGLGLAIVRRLADLLNLKVRMHSVPGQGTEMTVLAPRDGELSLPTMRDAGLPPPARQLQVLVVDDEEAIRDGMTSLLEGMGFEVQAASSTETAVASSRRVRPSIVLADFRLRGQDNGMQTIRALRGIWPDLPALLISGDTAPDRLREAHGAGIELLHKPVSSLLLRESILKAVHA